ncbi:MAG: alpha/beta hydrolase, partial [Bacteroidales bacterium]|nr:alpha/beta hydrolase [Bacteroidales bacterium]
MKTIQHISILLFLSALTLVCNTNAYSQMNPLINLPEYASFDDIPYPFELHKVQLSNEVNLAYVDEGTGKETIIFIHGLGSYLPAWKKNIEVLRNDYRCIAIDLPGYG